MFLWRLVSLTLSVIVGSTYGNPSEPRGQTKIIQSSLNQQSLQSILNSIEDRLRSLDNVYSLQYSPSVESRLVHLGRKLDSMEAKINRLEALVSSEIEKLLETISGRNFKEDIANDHVIRKIDNAYERLNHRVVFSEGKIDLSEKKLENKLNTILTKLDKLEDTLMIRDSDMQEEISEVFASVEEVKVQSDNVLEKLENVTKGVKVIQGSPTGRNINPTIHTNATENFEKEIKKQLGVLSEKVVNFHEYSWTTFNRIENYLRSIGLVTNQSRYEVQSGLRSLTIEVGRMAGNHHLLDNSKGREKLDELEKKMESNFNSLMLAQNTFLESCYRVQNDEAQFESKIGDVLEKLLDTFSEKTVVEPKDIRRIEQILKNHDQYMRKSSVDTVKTVASLLQKDHNFEKKFDNTLSAVTTSLESLQNAINEQNADDTFDTKLEEIITALKELQSLSIDINTSIKTTIREAFPNFQELRSLIQNLQSQTKEDMIKENFENLSKILDEIRSRIVTYFNRTIDQDRTVPTDLPIDNTTQITFNDSSVMVNCVDLPFDVRFSLNCTNETETNPIIPFNEANNTLIDCADLPIDVRNVNNCRNASVPDGNVTSTATIDRLITEIFLRNFTTSSNVAVPGITEARNNIVMSVNDDNNSLILNTERPIDNTDFLDIKAQESVNVEITNVDDNRNVSIIN